MSLLTRVNSITRHIYKDALYEWIVAVSKALGGGIPFIVGVGPFDTVARASSSRMLDAPAAGLAELDDGVAVWVASFGGSTWYWDKEIPAGTVGDNETVCIPTEWAATGDPGGFVRQATGTRLAASQAAWFVDSSAADNEGTGSSLQPLKTDNEIGRRWGAGVQLAIPVTITYAQTPTAITVLSYTLLTGGSVTFNGATTTTKSTIAITAVTAQNRGTQTRWGITGATLAAGDIGNFAIIRQSGTPGNIGAYARILKDNTGGNVTVSPFLKFSPVIASTTQVTPLVGDIIDVVTFSTLNVGRIEARSAFQTNPQASPTRQATVFDQILLTGGAGFAGELVTSSAAMFYARCVLSNIQLSGPTSTSGVGFHVGCGAGISGFVIVRKGCVFQTKQCGIVGNVSLFGGGSFIGDADTYFQNGGLYVQPGSTAVTNGVNWTDCSPSNSALVISPGAVCQQTGATADWGTNNLGHGISIQSTGLYVYATKPTINGGLGAGREAIIGGTDKLYTAVPYVEGANNAVLALVA